MRVYIVIRLQKGTVVKQKSRLKLKEVVMETNEWRAKGVANIECGHVQMSLSVFV